MRTYQTVPLTSRSRVTRRLTASTVPLASPTSTTSPTPYWSSKIMKMPDRKSLTRLCAPKPSATPRMPALGDQRADVVAELRRSTMIADDREDHAGGDALEQAAHRLGPAATRRVAAVGSPSSEALASRRRWTSGRPAGEHAVLGALDEPVDHPVQDPADDESDDDQAQDGERLADQPVGASAAVSLPVSVRDEAAEIVAWSGSHRW